MVKALPQDRLPKHIGVMLDGNRRWAKAVGADTAHGHRAGAANIEPLLGWCEEIGIEVVTLWLLSTDNLNRPAARARRRCSRIIEEAVDSLADQRRWRLHPVGALDLLPARDRAPAQGGRGGHPRRRRDAGQHRGRVRRPPRDRGRRAVAAASSTPPRAPRSRSSPQTIDVEHIAEHLYTKGQPDPDLVIRTSGEQRLGGFLLWQSREERVLLLRGLLARLPPRRLPARHPRVRRAGAPLRLLTSRATDARRGEFGASSEGDPLRARLRRRRQGPEGPARAARAPTSPR